jgi:hypothetical protein
LARAIRHVTRQWVDLIPKIYDTERVGRIVGIDGEVDMVKINPSQPEPVKKIVDQAGNVIEKIYNPSVGTYDVMVTTGPGYMTKRQEALDAMGNILQTNPQLWQVAGDLFVKNMDWPGAQEMAARFKKIIDPRVLSDDDKSPELQQAEKLNEAMQQELTQVTGMLKNIGQSMEAQELKVKEFEAEVKAFDAETKRISVVQASMNPEQIQDIIMGTLHGMMTSGDLVMPSNERTPMEPGAPPDMQAPPEMGMEAPPEMGMEAPPDMGQMPDMGQPQ